MAIPHQASLWRRRPRRLLIIAVIALLFIPLPFSKRLPATLQISQPQEIVTPFAAQIENIHIKQGMWVEKGSVMVTLSRSDTHHEKETLADRISTLETLLVEQRRDEEEYAPLHVVRKQLQSARMALQSLQQRQQQHRVKAPHSGQLLKIHPLARPGAQVAQQLPLFTLGNEHQGVIETWGTEDQLDGLKAGQQARFQADIQAFEPIVVTIIGPAPIAVVTAPSSQHLAQTEAAIQTQPTTDNDPSHTRMRVEIQTDVPAMRMHGHLWVDTQAQSLATTLTQKLHNLTP
ncbi:HlyD family efflux transporter periplasmic adaptor subunit [Magnetococcus sp. PR-3]|uniref:HlyD family efflux transporter periplasmic adaptor subunit n=1 Tax=Magnetococcus sp. PR-3 TaxID=3120355 RepID=UPI002FCDF26C